MCCRVQRVAGLKERLLETSVNCVCTQGNHRMLRGGTVKTINLSKVKHYFIHKPIN